MNKNTKLIIFKSIGSSITFYQKYIKKFYTKPVFKTVYTYCETTEFLIEIEPVKRENYEYKKMENKHSRSNQSRNL